MSKSKNPTPTTFTVGTRLTTDEIVSLDSAADAAHLGRSAYIRRILKGRIVRFFPCEVLLAEAIALFWAMRTSIEREPTNDLDRHFVRLDGILDRLAKMTDAERRR